MKCNSVREVRVEGGGGGLVGLVGLHALGCLLIVWGWGRLCRVVCSGAVSGPRAMIGARCWTQAMLMLAGGGELRCF